MAAFDEATRVLTTRPRLAVRAGLLLAPLPVLLLFFQFWIAWIVCPYALMVMFIRQSLQAYDSLGAADVPDLLVALLQFPLLGFLLARAARKGSLKPTLTAIFICH